MDTLLYPRVVTLSLVCTAAAVSNYANVRADWLPAATRQLQLKQQMLSCVKMCNDLSIAATRHTVTQSRSQDTGHDYDTFISSETC